MVKRPIGSNDLGSKDLGSNDIGSNDIGSNDLESNDPGSSDLEPNDKWSKTRKRVKMKEKKYLLLRVRLVKNIWAERCGY